MLLLVIFCISIGTTECMRFVWWHSIVYVRTWNVPLSWRCGRNHNNTERKSTWTEKRTIFDTVNLIGRRLLSCCCCCCCCYCFPYIDGSLCGLMWVRSGPVPDDSNCGSPAITPSVTLMDRIIGGMEALAHSWPWQCSIRYKYMGHVWGQYCGASVLDSRHVVTAAHCLLVTLFSRPLNYYVPHHFIMLPSYVGWE